MCFDAFRLHAAPNGAGSIRGSGGYKHVAPPEQETSIPMMTTSRGAGQSSFVKTLFLPTARQFAFNLWQQQFHNTTEFQVGRFCV